MTEIYLAAWPNFIFLNDQVLLVFLGLECIITEGDKNWHGLYTHKEKLV